MLGSSSRRSENVMAQQRKKTLEQLPWSVVMRLTQLLDRDQPEHHSWRSLLSHAEVIDVKYTTDEVANFQSIANRAVGSPSVAVIQDFTTRGITTDDLYVILKDMGHVRGMELLNHHVSPHLVSTENDSRGNGSGEEGGGVNSDQSISSTAVMSSSQYQYHPDIGPLPLNVPATVIGTTVLRVPQSHHIHQPLHDPASSHHMTFNSHAHQRHSSSGSSSSSSHYPSHAHSPNQSGYFFSPQGTPTAQFSSPPPPPYSPQIDFPPSLHQQHHFRDYSGSSSRGQVVRHFDGSGSPSTHGGSQGTSPVFSPPQQQGTVPFPWGEGLDDMAVPPAVRSQLLPSPSNGTTATDDSSVNTPSSSSSGAAAAAASSGGGGADFKLSILRFSYADLSTATRIFTEGLVGHGAFGSVFRANVRGCGPYAIKKLHNRSEMQSELEGTLFFEPLHQESFMLELQSLVKYKHRNILSLVAISDDGPRPCLVYEYMENGSLADCLLGKKNVHLDWKLRLEIARQVGDALNFLHRVNEPQCLIHGDVKSSNILLDRHLTPKLSDFGLARECLNRPNHITTVSANSRVAMGTVAYMAPEFLRNSKPSSKTDVYAFGVVMLELFTGQAADDPSRDIRTLVYHLQPLFNDPDKNREMVLHESDVRARWPPDTALNFFVIATFCLQSKPKLRPPMDQVRDQIIMLLDEAVVVQQPMEDLHISSQQPPYSRHHQRHHQ